MALHLAGKPLPALPELPGRRFVARDEPLPAECLADITRPSELALILGISQQAASQRLQRARAAAAAEPTTLKEPS